MHETKVRQTEWEKWEFPDFPRFSQIFPDLFLRNVGQFDLSVLLGESCGNLFQHSFPNGKTFEHLLGGLMVRAVMGLNVMHVPAPLCQPRSKPRCALGVSR